MKKNRTINIILLLFALFIFYFLAHGCSEHPQQGPSGGQKTEPIKVKKLIELNLPFGLGPTKLPISEKYKIPLVITVLFLALVYYLPKGYFSMRESMTGMGSKKAALELEQMRFVILKTKYEIEALKKEHKLTDIALVEVPETKIKAPVKPEKAVSNRKERKRQIILQQIKEIDSRKRFVFRRFFAFLLDLYVLGLAIGFIGPILYGNFPFVADYIFSSIIILYLPVMWATLDATVGKMVMGLRIVTVDGKPLTYKEALIRYIVWLPLSGLAFCWVFWDKGRQALYDKAAKTLVVTVRRRRRREL